jgi:hypothetical protein
VSSFFHHIFPFHLSTSVLSRSPLLENCIMPRQSTTKRNAEGSHHESEAMPTKKLQKASSQPVLNSPPRLTSTADSSLSESSPPPSLTSDSSIEDSSSSTANSVADKSSSGPSTTGACSASVLQEARPNHGGASLKELYAMSLEELKEYGRSRGWEVRTWSALTLTVGVHANWRLNSS